MDAYDRFLAEQYPRLAESLSWNGDLDGRSKFGRAAFEAGKLEALKSSRMGEILAQAIVPVALKGVVDGTAQKLARLEKLEEFFKWACEAPVSSGVCMCGDSLADHGVHSDHPPTDVWTYSIEQYKKEL